MEINYEDVLRELHLETLKKIQTNDGLEYKWNNEQHKGMVECIKIVTAFGIRKKLPDLEKGEITINQARIKCGYKPLSSII